MAAHRERGFAALPQHRVGWAVGMASRERLPWCIIMIVCEVSGGGRHLACWVQRGKKKKLPFPAARPGEGERGTMSFKMILFCSLSLSLSLFYNMKRRCFIQISS